MSEPPSVGFQITSDPDRTTAGAPTGGAAERERGGAFRLVLVADLDPQAAQPDWADGDRVWDVDVNTFAERMREHGPRLDVTVPGLDGERLPVAWTADALDAFTPAGIVSRVPGLAAAAQAQAALDDARRGGLGLDALRERLRQTGVAGADDLTAAVAARPASPPASPSSGGPLDALFGMVALDADDTSPPVNPLLDALVGGPSGPSDIDRAAAERVAADVAGRLRKTLAAIVEYPDVRRAEAGWRGLKLLVDRLAFPKGARLSVLAAPKAALAQAVHHQVLLAEHARPGQTPLAAVLLDHAVEATSADLAALGDLAASGASLQVPIVVGASPAFFGLDGPTDFARLPPVAALFQRTEYAALRSLQARPEAAFLALAIPPFLLRTAFGPDHPDPAHGVEGGERLWGSGALLVGLAMAEAHRERGWPTASAGQAVPDLPVWAGRTGATPLAAAFGNDVVADLARAGVLAFAGPLGSDRAVLGSAAMVAAGDVSGDAHARPSLPAAVFTALATHRALTLGAACAGLDPDAAGAEIDRRFRAFVRGDAGPVEPDAVTVQHVGAHDTAASRTYAVRLRPSRDVLPEPVGVVLGVEVPRATAGG
ncbi:type VI secretion system contractile sheath domain-containing protein [Rubrivirga sp.]|uniref:type VI secretion system contractile sheath domain-containing protein n=1 Tax=Rubrivirga sp. TaxID=1885344 RepID=UPI003B5178E9